MIIFAMPDLPSIFVYIIISSNYDAPIAPHFNTINHKNNWTDISGCMFIGGGWGYRGFTCSLVRTAWNVLAFIFKLFMPKLTYLYYAGHSFKDMLFQTFNF
jgi:hypothetical protein